MMKKSIKLLILIWVLPYCAWGSVGGELYSRFCPSSWLYVKNNTHHHCYLIQKNTDNIDIYDKPILSIPAGEDEKTTAISVTNILRGSGDVTLTYVCGQGMVSFKTHLNACAYDGVGAITGEVLSIGGMDVNHYTLPSKRFRTTDMPYYSLHASRIHWSFATDPGEQPA